MVASTIAWGLRYDVVGVDPPNGAAATQRLAEDVDAQLTVINNALDARLDIVEPRPRGILGRARRTTEGPTSGGSIASTLRLDDIAVAAGRMIRCAYTIHPRSTVGGDLIVSELRYTTDGATPTTGSPILPGSQSYSRGQVTDMAQSVTIETVYAPAGAETLSLLLCITRALGTGVVRHGADANATTDIIIEDIGVAVGDTGVDI